MHKLNTLHRRTSPAAPRKRRFIARKLGVEKMESRFMWSTTSVEPPLELQPAQWNVASAPVRSVYLLSEGGFIPTSLAADGSSLAAGAPIPAAFNDGSVLSDLL